MAAPIAGKGAPAGKNRPEQSVIDAWVANCLRETALAMGGWLQANDDMNKPVHKLSLRELQGMAWAVLAKYNDLREIERKRFEISLLDDQSLDDLGFTVRDDKPGAI